MSRSWRGRGRGRGGGGSKRSTTSSTKTPFHILPVHTIPESERNWDLNYRQIFSIDPGCKNLAFRVERRWFETGFVESILFDRVSLSEDLYLALGEIINTFEKHSYLFDTTHFVLIEQQLPDNDRMIRIGHHIMGYFMTALRNRPLLPYIIEVNNKLKLTYFGIESGLSYNAYIKEYVAKALQILEAREDTIGVDKINNERVERGGKMVKKPDDLAAVVCQMEAWVHSCGDLVITGKVPVVDDL